MKKELLKLLIVVGLAILQLQAANAQDNLKTIRLEYMVQPNGGIIYGSLRDGEIKYSVVDSAWHFLITVPTRMPPVSSKQYFLPAPLRKRFVLQTDDRALFCLSSDQYNKLKETACLEFESQYLAIVTTDYPRVYYADGKKLHAIVAENNTGSLRIWVLDNPFFPIILKTEGSSLNVDIELISVK